MDKFSVNNAFNNCSSFGPNIVVVGVGGAGQNAVDNMLRLGLNGVNFIICNTDAQTITQSLCPEDMRVCLGYNLTKGLGAGSSPEIGKSAAEESLDEVMSKIEGAHMLFITAGMGGGTGTGAAPVIARAAMDRGILTIGVVTKPFQFEGPQRLRAAEHGISVMKECVDTLLVIPNQNLFRLATDSTTFAEAFAMADEVLYSAVRTFTDVMVNSGLVNLDFADIRTVVANTKCKAMIGTGEASGENRAIEAAKKAISCPLIEDVDLSKAKSVLIHIAGGLDMKLYEVDEAASCIKQEVDQNANIIFGSTFDETLAGSLRVSVVATGIEYEEQKGNVSNTVLEQKEAVEEVSLINKNYDYLGSRHGNTSFEERHFSSMSAHEDSDQYGKIDNNDKTNNSINNINNINNNTDNNYTDNNYNNKENIFDRDNHIQPERFSMFKKIANLGKSQIFKKQQSSNNTDYNKPYVPEEQIDNNSIYNKKSVVTKIKDIGIDIYNNDELKTQNDLDIVPAFLRQDKKKRGY